MISIHTYFHKGWYEIALRLSKKDSESSEFLLPGGQSRLSEMANTYALSVVLRV